MKNLLYIFLFLPVICLGQAQRQITPTGFQQRISPFTSISGTTEQNIYADTIKAGALNTKFSKIRFTISCNVTTSGINLSNLSLRFVNGSNSVNLINALNLSLATTTRPIVITGSITNQGNGNAYVKLLVEQDGNTINGISNWYGVRAIWPMNFSSAQPIYLKGTIGGLAITGTTIIGIDEIERQGF